MELAVLIVSFLWLTGAQDAVEKSNDTSKTAMPTTTTTTEKPVTDGNVTYDTDIAHGCPNAPRIQAGVQECLYYCDYVSANNTWLYGFYIPDGLDCWAGDDLPGRCLQGVCYPDEHGNVTHLPPRTDRPE